MDFFKEHIIPGEVIVQLLAFLIVFFTLKAMAWKPLLKGLESRREKIKADIDHLAVAKKEMETLKAEYSAHLQRIDEEARSKIQEAVEEGRRVARDIQEKARSDAQETFEKTKENIVLEAEKARIQLRREVADLTIRVSEKILGEHLTEKKQQEQILRLIEEMESTVGPKGKAS